MSRKMEIAQITLQVRKAVWLAPPLLLVACACGDRLRPVIHPRGGSPGVPITGELRVSLTSLPEGATASLPAFNGDAFTVVLPVRAQAADLAPAQILQEIEPVLRGVGFQRSLEELRVPDEPVHLPPADLEPLAEEVCREAALQQEGTAREVCAALRNAAYQGSAQAAFRNAYDVSLADFREDFERHDFQYPFSQLVNGVVIDGVGVFATRRSGESLSTVHGTLLNDYQVVNEPSGDSRAVLEAARRMLAKRFGKKLRADLRWSGPVLVLLPYGSGSMAGGGEVPALRHAWRALLESRDGRSWLVWVDAETAEILDLAPQWDHAQGERWRRDPGPLASKTEVVSFDVNPGSSFLSLSGVFRRVDRYGDDIFDEGDEVAVAGGNFNISPINNEAPPVCAEDADRDNPAYRQVHAYSHLHSLWRIITKAGSIQAFPHKPIGIQVDVPDDGDGSQAFYDSSTLKFVDGDGFLSSACPNGADERLNGVHDVTTLAHEMAHLSVKRLQERRPPNWCGGGGCQLPNSCGRSLFHDFADAVGLAYASTNCFSGWTHKNVNGTDASLYCRQASEAGGLPRRIEVSKDRFPDHQALGTGPYADGQIAAAALWTVRQGMRSKDAASGSVLFWARLQRALWDYAFIQPTCLGAGCKACDRDLYRYLQNLETKMVAQWATGVPDGHSANKVLAGWAAAGIFLVPFECVDQDPCNGGGGDAVIDVDDRDTADDPLVDGVTHPEVDYLKRGGPPPRFRVWTGPRFRFDNSGKAIAGPALCHTRYTVEVSNDPTLSGAQTVDGTTATCFSDVDLPVNIWNQLKGAAGIAKIYYRVRTRDAANSNERTSTSPGNGAFNVPPPFVTVNDTGRP